MRGDKEKNIVLIGMPGAGNSTVGVLLAKVMCRDFIDTDVSIQSKENRSLQEIIDTLGTDSFRRIEERYVASLLCHRTIIATGGSVVYSEPAMAHLKDSGIICHLFLPLEHLEKRLTNFRERGVVRRPGQDLFDLFHERISLYRNPSVTRGLKKPLRF